MAADERQQASTEVPLRDYMSSRVDQLRVELLNRIELLDRQMRDIIDERDRQYAQRFSAQEAATHASLAAAKEAVTKAETASDKRFDNVNEFRAQLDDQADTFMPKAEASVRFNVLEDKINSLTSRMDATKNIGVGRDDTWAFVVAGVVLIITVAGFALNYNRQKAAA